MGIIADSEQMQRVCRTVEKLAPTDVTVILLGESGTGKELLAKALHKLSPRNANRFVTWRPCRQELGKCHQCFLLGFVQPREQLQQPLVLLLDLPGD